MICVIRLGKSSPLLSIYLQPYLKKCYHKKNYAYFNLVYSICHRVNIYMLVVLFAGIQRTFTTLHFLTIKALLKRYSVNVYIFIRYPNFSIVPFHNNDKLFKGSNALLKLPHTHPLCYTFLIKNLQNRYTRKQPTHFSMAPLRLKLKTFFFKTHKPHNLYA